MKLTMYIGIVWPKLMQNIYVNDELMTKQIETDFVPNIGDKVELYDAEGKGPHWYVKSRYMDANGNWHIEFSRIIMNPDEDARNRISLSVGCQVWWTESDGEPEALLRAGGWHVYGE